tara:strand:+ start:65 stop:277 length:213 start_codon:yes stop_codon:yes gene_type:complete
MTKYYKHILLDLSLKQEMYCPDTMGTFRMMFGFAQPIKYIKDNRVKDRSRDYDKIKAKYRLKKLKDKRLT